MYNKLYLHLFHFSKSVKPNQHITGNELSLSGQTTESQNEQNIQNRSKTDLYNENAYTDLTKPPPKTDGDYDQVYQAINEKDLQMNDYERHLSNSKAVEDRRETSYKQAFPNQTIRHVL